MDETTNITTIKFDDVLLEEIKSFKEKYVKHYKLNLNSHTTDEMEVIQNNIRNDIEKYLLPNLNYSTHKDKASKPNMYALYILMLLDDPKQFNDWTDLSYVFYNHNNNDLNTIKSYKHNLNLEFVTYTYDPQYHRCACGKHGCNPNKMGIIGNENIAFLFGSFCINKSGIEFSKMCDKRIRKKEKEMLEKEKEMLEKALDCLVYFGKYKYEMTFRELGKKDPRYLIYMKTKLNFFDSEYNDKTSKYNNYYNKFIDSLI
jgi:hypothetical protein